MSPTKKFIFGLALLLGGVRVALFLVRTMTPPSPAVLPVNAEEVSQREARKAEQRAKVAELLEASVSDLEDREFLDQARGDAVRALRDLGREANAAGHTAMGFEAFALEQSLLRDARTICSLDALKKLDAASSALTPAARAPFAERLAIVHRHVTRTCELATR